MNQKINADFFSKNKTVLHVLALQFLILIMLNDIIEFQGQRLLKREFILSKVPPSTYANGVSMYDKGESQHWANLKIGGDEFIVFDSLTPMIQQRLGNIQDLLNESLVEIPECDKSTGVKGELSLLMDFAYTNKRLCSRYLPHYTDRFLTSNEIEMLVRTHSVVDAILGFKKEGHSMKDIFEVFNKNQKKYHLKNFKATSYKYFCQKLDTLESDGIANGLVNGNRHSEKDSVLRSKYILQLIAKFYSQNQPVLKYHEIVDKVNHEIGKKGYKDIKEWVVKRVASQPDFQNRWKPHRILGAKWAENNLEPFLARRTPEDAMQKLEVDGSPIWTYTLVGKDVTRLWLEAAIDCHSRKCVAFAVGRYETSFLVRQLYLQIVLNTGGTLPAEICHDNASAFKSKLVAELESRLEERGTYITWCSPERPQSKGTVEQFWEALAVDHFRILFADKYTGSSLRDQREEFRLEPKKINELRKTANLSTVDETIAMVRKAIESYNQTIF